MLRNGIIEGENIQIIASDHKIFDNIILKGHWNSKDVLPEWFLGKNFKNAHQNFEVLKQFVEINASVFLNNILPIAVKHGEECFSGGRNIIIKGKDKKSSGLIFESKHSNLFFSYFRSVQGYNINLENMSLTTRDFIDGKLSDKSAEYFFSGTYYHSQLNPVAKPSLDSIRISNCMISGNISIAVYGAHSDNQTIQEFGSKNKISDLEVKNCHFDNANTPFVFSNMGYKNILIKNNVIKNFSETFLSISESGLNETYYEPLRKNKKTIEITNNIFENTRVVFTANDRALTPCVIKGGYGTLLFTGNTLKNLLPSNPYSDVYTLYYTCAHPGKCTFHNNTVTNVLGKGGSNNPASIIKDRGAQNLNMQENTFMVEKDALIKIGVIKSKNDDLSKIDGNTFLCTFMQIGNQTDFTKKMVFKNNTVRAPFINLSTEIYDIADLLFENNILEFEYFGPSGKNISVSRDGVFFLGRKRLDRIHGSAQGNFIMKGNRISIQKTRGNRFFYIQFPDGVQVGTLQNPDINYNYKNVIVQDNFYLNETQLGISLLDGENHQFDIQIDGQNNSIHVDDATGANHLRPNAKSYQSSVRFKKYKNSEGAPFVLIPGSTQKIIIEKRTAKKFLYFHIII
ncbi:MAG: hypothetical protein IPN79_12260 [Saprospiraceae bacterium]|nr:hypothetical protein [Saprospiraceae bacterium]